MSTHLGSTHDDSAIPHQWPTLISDRLHNLTDKSYRDYSIMSPLILISCKRLNNHLWTWHRTPVIVAGIHLDRRVKFKFDNDLDGALALASIQSSILFSEHTTLSRVSYQLQCAYSYILPFKTWNGFTNSLKSHDCGSWASTFPCPS